MEKEDAIRTRKSEEVIGKLLQAIRIGVPLRVALASAWISEAEYGKWEGIYGQTKELKELGIPSKRLSQEEISRLIEGKGFDPSLVEGLQRNRAYADEVIDLCRKIEQGLAEAVVYHMTKVAKAERNSSWQASAWWLERRMPEMFAKKEPDQAESKPVGKITVQYVDPHEDDDRVAEMQHTVESETEGKKE